MEETRTVDIEVKRENLNTEGVAGGPSNQQDDNELYVQVGEHTQVFKYGDKDDEDPKLIDQYISYFKEGDSRRRVTKVTKSLIRNRSHSEDAFFKRDRKQSLDKGFMHRGLIGAEGTANPSQSPDREVIIQKENSTRRLRNTRISKAGSFLESKETPPELNLSTQMNPIQEVRPSGATSKPSFGRK